MHRDLKIMRRSNYRLVEIFYFPITTIIIWGLFAVFAREFAAEAGLMILVVNVFWNFALVSQSSTNQMMNVDVWSGSIKQILTSGVTGMEYLVARILSAIIAGVGVLAVMMAMAYGFGFTAIVSNAWLMIYLSLATLVASIGLAALVATVFVYLGREYGFVAWTAIQAFVLLSAPFYPVSVFPGALQEVSKAMPFTNIFEGIRMFVSQGFISQGLLFWSIVIAAIYLVVALPLYQLAFERARRVGILVRMG